MDGIEATRHIRKLGYTRPIVALTADAIIGVQEMFLSNGFDDYISKPLNIAGLNDLLEKWIPPDENKNTDLITDLSGAIHTLEINIPGINAELGLSLYDDDKELFVDLLRLFTDGIPGEADKLRNVSLATLPAYAIDAHTIKGAGASVGATVLTETARRMEQMAKAGNLSGVIEGNAGFIKEIEVLIADIHNWLRHNEK
jgi:CheY-like chemotaxis protein